MTPEERRRLLWCVWKGFQAAERLSEEVRSGQRPPRRNEAEAFTLFTQGAECVQHLLERNLNLAHKFAWRELGKYGDLANHPSVQEAAINAAYLGLYEAICRFDPRQQTALSTYANHRIRYRVQEAIRAFLPKGGTTMLSLDDTVGDSDTSFGELIGGEARVEEEVARRLEGEGVRWVARVLSPAERVVLEHIASGHPLERAARKARMEPKRARQALKKAATLLGLSD